MVKLVETQFIHRFQLGE